MTYYHLTIAQPIKDDAEYVEVLEEAQDNGWSGRRLAEEVAQSAALEMVA